MNELGCREGVSELSGVQGWGEGRGSGEFAQGRSIALGWGTLEWGVLWLDEGRWRRIALRTRLLVGSGPEAELRIERPEVASRHCRLNVVGDEVFVSHMGDRGSTTVAGEILGGRARLASAGEVVRVAGVPLIVLRQRREGRRRWLQVGELGSGAPGMWEALAELCLAAPSPWPVLLTGETGTGKELAARLIHALGGQRGGPMITVNCAAFNAGTLQAELFGARRGAYTGSVAERKGAFERAQDGTLFLDEVGELPLDAQAALLRVLESGEIQVVGGEVRSVDVRIVAATNRPLKEAVAAGRFRLDLLHRLEVVCVHLPPLRSRGGDAAYLLERFCDGQPLPAGAAEMMAAHRWPGNIRELRNVARRLSLIGGGAPSTLSDLSRALRLLPPSRPPLRSSGQSSKQVRERERIAQVRALMERCGSTKEALRESGLGRTTFFRLLRLSRTQGSDSLAGVPDSSIKDIDTSAQLGGSTLESGDLGKGCRFLDVASGVDSVRSRPRVLPAAA